MGVWWWWWCGGGEGRQSGLCRPTMFVVLPQQSLLCVAHGFNGQRFASYPSSSPYRCDVTDICGLLPAILLFAVSCWPSCRLTVVCLRTSRRRWHGRHTNTQQAMTHRCFSACAGKGSVLPLRGGSSFGCCMAACAEKNLCKLMRVTPVVT